MMRLLLIALMLAGCGPVVPNDTSDPVSIELLDQQYEARLAAFSEALNSGWPGGDDCDGTLWAGLAAAAGVHVDLDVVEYEPGRVGRRPTPCAIPAESRSSVSNDMLLGYMIGRWAQDDTAALQRLYDYAMDHNLVMGEPFPERAAEVVLKYNQLALLRKSLDLLTLPPKYFAVEADFEQHLQMLSIDWYGQLWGAVDLDAASHAQTLCVAHPTDALFQSVCGHNTQAMLLLLDPDYVAPSYARGNSTYREIHWLYAAHRVLHAAGRAP